MSFALPRGTTRTTQVEKIWAIGCSAHSLHFLRVFCPLTSTHSTFQIQSGHRRVPDPWTSARTASSLEGRHSPPGAAPAFKSWWFPLQYLCPFFTRSEYRHKLELRFVWPSVVYIAFFILLYTLYICIFLPCRLIFTCEWGGWPYGGASLCERADVPLLILIEMPAKNRGVLTLLIFLPLTPHL